MDLDESKNAILVRGTCPLNSLHYLWPGTLAFPGQRLERAIGVVSVTALHPESRLSIMQSGLQVVIRYPVELEHASEIDDRVTREVLNATGREPKLRVLEPAPEPQAPQDAVKEAGASS